MPRQNQETEIVAMTKQAFAAICGRIEQLERRFDHAPERLVEERLYDYHEAAEILGVCCSTLRNYRDQGRISSIQLGRSVRFKMEHLEEFIERRTK